MFTTVTRRAGQTLASARCSGKIGAASVNVMQRRMGSSGGHHEHHDVGPTAHPEKWLKIAREWPHEYYALERPHIESTKNWPPHPDGSETLETKETFFNATWGRFVLLGLFGYGLYKVNEYVTADQEEHPITRLLGSFIKSQDEIDKEMTAWLNYRRKEANDLLILENKPLERPMYRVSFPERFFRASDHLIEPGTQIDLSDLKVKHQWEENDDLFGPPFPKNA
ncbi:hypothetical protein HDU97_008918 [Phlyctochytrium planicorne]|nr:hypothetical protein HDU97_008918 [Phlyctochytrium planicorne]